MIDLIKRLEAATEGSVWLDRDIALLGGWTLRAVEGFGHRRWFAPDGIRTAFKPDEFPHAYTRSLDAALTLVPDGWYGEIRWWGDRSDAAAAAYVGPTSDRRFKGIAETMPLALCIAALKARNEGEERA